MLKKYGCLWRRGKGKRPKPRLYIVNLQYTPKDSQAELKISGMHLKPTNRSQIYKRFFAAHCDTVMMAVARELDMHVPIYDRQAQKNGDTEGRLGISLFPISPDPMILSMILLRLQHTMQRDAYQAAIGKASSQRTDSRKKSNKKKRRPDGTEKECVKVESENARVNRSELINQLIN